MKRLLFIILALSISFLLVSCSKDEDREEAIAFFELKKGDDCLVQDVQVEEMDSITDVVRYHIDNVDGIIGDLDNINGKPFYGVYNGVLHYDYVEVAHYAEVKIYHIYYVQDDKPDMYDVVFFKNRAGEFELLTEANLCDLIMYKQQEKQDGFFSYKDNVVPLDVADGWVRSCFLDDGREYTVYEDCVIRKYTFLQSLLEGCNEVSFSEMVQ